MVIYRVVPSKMDDSPLSCWFSMRVNLHFPMVFPWFSHDFPMFLWVFRLSPRRPVPGPRPRGSPAALAGAVAIAGGGLEVGRGHGGAETRRWHERCHGVWGETQSLVPWNILDVFFCRFSVGVSHPIKLLHVENGFR